MIVILPGRYFSHFYFAMGAGYDALGATWRDAGKPFVFQYRFRYYSPDSTSPHDGKDRKSFYRVDFKAGQEEAEVESIVGGMFRAMTEQFGLDLHAISLRTDNSEAIREALTSVPWAHSKFARVAGTA